MNIMKQEGDYINTSFLSYHGPHGPAITSPPLTIKDEMQTMFVRLLFAQMVVEKQMEDQMIDSPKIITNLFDDSITVI